LRGATAVSSVMGLTAFLSRVFVPEKWAR